MIDLDSRVQATGGSALSTAKELLQQRHATRNVEAASQVIRQARSVAREVVARLWFCARQGGGAGSESTAVFRGRRK